MPFDGSGAFTRVHNWVSDRNNAIKITAVRHDEEDDGFATAFNQVLLRNGVAPLTGNLKMGDNKISGLNVGAAATPSISFTGDTTSGFYLSAAGEVSVATNAVQRARFIDSGMEIFYNFRVDGYMSVKAGKERAVVAAAALAGVVNLDMFVGTVYINTANATANFSFNLRGDATNTLDSQMVAGDQFCFAVEVPQGAAAFFCTTITVDGAAPSQLKWQYVAPIAGNVNSIDNYLIRVIKVAANTFLVRACLSPDV